MDAASPAQGGGSGGGNGGRNVGGNGGGSAGDGAVVDDGLDELWQSRPSSVAQMLANLWGQNPETSARWTSGLGGLDLDPEVWDVRIHFDGMDNLKRSIGRGDITYMNIIAMIETRGYRFGDSVYCRKGGELHLVENNVKIYELLLHFDSTKVLELTVKRGRDVVCKENKNAEQDSIAGDSASCLINYSDPVVYDFSPPPMYAVDDDGQVFTSQVASNNPVVCSQPSLNMQKAKEIALSESDDDADMGPRDAKYDMGDFANSAETRREEQAEVDEIVEALRKQREDPMTHCEWDTDIEDLFVSSDEPVVEEHVEPVHVPKMMAYMAKNHALDAVLGDHKEQYFRLRDWAQTVIDRNPGSRPPSAATAPCDPPSASTAPTAPPSASTTPTAPLSASTAPTTPPSASTAPTAPPSASTAPTAPPSASTAPTAASQPSTTAPRTAARQTSTATLRTAAPGPNTRTEGLGGPRSAFAAPRTAAAQDRRPAT
ncbi:hypothetical protein ACQ4PT_062629 [Festuca glaucescens]